MSVGTGIEWAEATWNCLVGCTPVSAGCLNCYAAGDVWRHSHPCKKGPRKGQPNHPAFVGLTVKRNGRAVFNGQVRMLEDKLTVPLKRKKATRWFVNSLSDLFHESVSFEFVDRVMAVAALCPQHQFLVLTKRAERMEEYLRSVVEERRGAIATEVLGFAGTMVLPNGWADSMNAWPLPNVWLGTSCEDQAAADARIPHLLRCPAAVRFLSCEPLLGAVDLSEWLPSKLFTCQQCGDEYDDGDLSRGRTPCCMAQAEPQGSTTGIDWVIVGGESGRGARACNVEWVRSIVGQCKSAGVACFVKQLGAKPEFEDDRVRCSKCGYVDDIQAFDGMGADEGHLFCNKCGKHGRHEGSLLGDRKGGDPDEWAEDLRVREMPGEGNRHQAIGTRGDG